MRLKQSIQIVEIVASQSVHFSALDPNYLCCGLCGTARLRAMHKPSEAWDRDSYYSYIAEGGRYQVSW